MANGSGYPSNTLTNTLWHEITLGRVKHDIWDWLGSWFWARLASMVQRQT